MKHNFDFDTILAHIRSDARKALILDTDTYNEVDDQFAVAYAALAEDIDLRALTAAPFYNDRSSSPEDGMEKSYEELLRVRSLLGDDCRTPICRGSRGYLTSMTVPQRSEAADTIVRLAKESEDILYVACIGCFTNVASALLLDPSITEKIIVLLVGGNDFRHESANEFNLEQDRLAARVIFESGVPVILLPAYDGTCELRTTTGEVAYFLGGGKAGAIGEYLVSLFETNEGKTVGEDGVCCSHQRVIWDIAAVAFLRGPDRFCHVFSADSRTVDARGNWTPLDNGRRMLSTEHFNRNEIFSDLFTVLEKNCTQKSGINR